MEYVDLGLPSGTMWAESNEEGYFDYEDAVAKYGDSLPTRNQLKELREECVWEGLPDGFKVIGPNGKSIVLTAEGKRSKKCGVVTYYRQIGRYLGSTKYTPNSNWCIEFSNIDIDKEKI